MKSVRTPEARFEGLPDFPFAPNYLTIEDTVGGTLRVHYVDEGPRTAAPVLCLHGEPTWSFLYRHMIPVFAKAGHRVVAPDLVGFGRSDKPTERADYTYARHVAWLAATIEQLDLRQITLVCQDWGGLLGLRVVAQMPDRFTRIVVANTALPTGHQPMGDAFKAWRTFSQTVPDFRAGRIVYGGTETKLTDAEQAAYDAPFPSDEFKAGARQFPMLVPDHPEDPGGIDNTAAWKVLQSLSLPVLTVFGAQDKVMAGADKVFQKRLPGAEGQPHTVLEGAGHFLQEDVGPELARLTCDFIARTS